MEKKTHLETKTLMWEILRNYQDFMGDIWVFQLNEVTNNQLRIEFKRNGYYIPTCLDSEMAQLSS